MKRTNEVTRQEGASDSGAKEDRKKELREIVDLVLPDGLMIALAFLMIPVAIIPVVMELSPGLVDFFDFADYTIIAVFVVEYLLKAALARDVKKHVLNPWHLLDLLIIVVPVVDFLHVSMQGLGRSSPLLRLLRVVRIVAIGGRTAKRISSQAATEPETPVEPVTVIRVMDNDLNNVHENVSMADLKDYVASPTHTWADVSPVSESDFEALSDALGVPRTLLETELADESYPHIGYFKHYYYVAQIGGMYRAVRIMCGLSALHRHPGTTSCLAASVTRDVIPAEAGVQKGSLAIEGLDEEEDMRLWIPAPRFHEDRLRGNDTQSYAHLCN